MARSARSGKTARYRAGLKAKHLKARLRKAGGMGKRKSGGRLKRIGKATPRLS